MYFKGRTEVDKLENMFAQAFSGIKLNGINTMTDYWEINVGKNLYHSFD